MNVGHGDGSLNVDLGESTGHVKSPAPAGLVETLPQLDSTERGIIRALPTAVARPRWETRYAPKVAVADGTDGGSNILGYSRDAQRKLLAKPGMTRLWHISGRSGLSEEIGPAGLALCVELVTRVRHPAHLKGGRHSRTGR